MASPRRYQNTFILFCAFSLLCKPYWLTILLFCSMYVCIVHVCMYCSIYYCFAVCWETLTYVWIFICCWQTPYQIYMESGVDLLFHCFDLKDPSPAWMSYFSPHTVPLSIATQLSNGFFQKLHYFASILARE